jgi:ribosomal protein S18 acetylase RimI-like enzyme
VALLRDNHRTTSDARTSRRQGCDTLVHVNERVVELREPAVIEAFARRDTGLHLYELGDLDPFFWPRTRWWGLTDDRELLAVALLYDGGDPPTLLALGRDDDGAVARLLASLREMLPARVYAHLSPGLAAELAPRFAATHHGRHLKLTLTELTSDDDVAEVRALTRDDLPALQDLYRRAYPGNWFDARMLATGRYFGIAEHDALVCVAGVHVYAPRHGVAALGNVTTDPTRRGRGLARRATARLCRALLDDGITTIGLNVLADNHAAIRCYTPLGFVVDAEYDEFMLEASDPHSGSRS